MNLGAQAVFQAGLQHLAGLLHGKGIGLAEHVAELGNALLLDGRHHLLAYQPDVLLTVLLVLGRNQVGTHEGSYNIHGMAVVQVLDHLERLQFVLRGQTVAALRLTGGHAKAHHLVQRLGRLLCQLLLRRLPCGVGGGLDPTARILDLQVGLSVELHPQFILTPAAENKMRVGVHQTGSNQIPLCIYYLGILHLRSSSCPHLGNDAVLYQNPGVFEHLDGALLRSLLGSSSLGGGQHTDVGQ